MARLIRLRAAPPTDALAYRTAVCVVVMISVVAAAAERAVPAGTAVIALAAIPAGFVLSYMRRHSRNVVLKIGLAAGLFAAFAGFLSEVRGAVTIDDTRVPLAALFVWVQVLHSMDVPRRRDLGFSLASSVSLMALAGSLSISTALLPFVAVYAMAFAVALGLRHLSELHEKASAADDSERPQRAEAVEATGAAAAKRPPASSVLRPTAAIAALVAVCSGVAFVGLPRFPGIQVASLPVQLARHTPIADFSGNVVNPGRRGESRDRTGGFAPDAYFGYGDGLDLRTRGRLSEELVFRVRSPEPALWRGQVYDSYVDGFWSSTDDDFVGARAGVDPAIVMPRPADGTSAAFARTREVVQTFYIERPLPNLVFHAHEARELFLPASRVEVDAFSTVRLDFLLEEDTIYSVISRVSAATPDELRVAAPPDTADPRLQRYLQLPDGLSAEFADLARSITTDAHNTYDRAAAVQDWLHRTKAYRLDIPPDPPGRDPVDVFVFERQEGFCEQIATTMALMLRASGVPTRLVAGYGAGERNPFTGYWEVRNADAHAWVEVLFPGFGWIPYDPTFGVPEATGASTRFMVEPLARFIGRLTPVRLVASALDVLRDALGYGSLVLGLLAAASVPVMLWNRRRRRVAAGTSPRDRIVAAWERVEAELGRHGCARAPNETVLEFASRASHDPAVDEVVLRRLVDPFLRLRYGPGEPDAPDAAACEELAADLVSSVRAHRPAPFALRRG